MRRAGGEVCFAQVFRDGRGEHLYLTLFVLWSLKLSVWFFTNLQLIYSVHG